MGRVAGAGSQAPPSSSRSAVCSLQCPPHHQGPQGREAGDDHGGPTSWDSRRDRGVDTLRGLGQCLANSRRRLQAALGSPVSVTAPDREPAPPLLL